MTGPVPRHKTALSRTALSRPLTTALEDSLLDGDCTLFDYGCGRGTDIDHLVRMGISASGWDPAHRPDAPREPAGVVNLGYVLNVIENPDERVTTLRAAWELAEQLLVVSARMTWDAKGFRGRPSGDGFITGLGTFQKFFTQDELRTLVQETLGAPMLVAAPGIIYVFRDPMRAHGLLAERTRRRTLPPEPWICEQLYQEHRTVLAPLVDFLTRRGRLPKGDELRTGQILRHFGSLARAFGIVATTTGEQHWERARERATAELLIFLALARFEGRPRFTHLPRTIQNDVRELTRTYKQGCVRADRLLLASGKRDLVHLAISASAVGKQTPTALYVHSSALFHIPPVLRVLEGCARAFVGVVPGANVVKLHRDESRVSYFSYPEFGRVPHPTLATAVTVDLKSRTVDFRDHRQSDNPPILHRTEEFLSPDDERCAGLKATTEAEKAAGLYEHPERIGTLDGWRGEVARCGERLDADFFRRIAGGPGAV
ncbi:DNA phosphorothioation-associated putative methyltransferase [Actinokineospora spheciospongiae]|uniref:DNA phosphorothioation-associated putative methyltransferase n=1 Tax=Actinokineospora spheciospongiae TaxID=909613 RepID=UPI000D7107F4|nr:DNA phosphorothioation-associated putative methyltransferase [Actinokineospora spheciospongiae]PWW65625.1 DNA phosphorothioation-associated putative methyltransferase [Actinokineospora spheciospongiae]